MAFKLLQFDCSMPRVLVAHEAFFESPFLEVPNEVSVPTTALLDSATSPASPTRLRVHAGHSFARWRVVRWARLESNWLARVKVAGNTLDSSWNTALLLLHCGCPLSVGPHASLLVHVRLRHGPVLRGDLLRGLHDHLPVLAGLRSVRRGHAAVARGWVVNGVGAVHGWLRVRRRRVLRGCHRGVGSLRSRIRLRLCGLCSLFAESLSLLLLLRPWCRGPVEGAGFQVHGWDERSRELLLSDKGMQLRLLGGPSLQGIYCEQAANKVDEGNPVVHFCMHMSAVALLKQ